MHGSHAKSPAQRLTLSLGHFAAVACVFWLLFGGGLQRFGLEPGTPERRALLAACSVVYFARMLFTTHVLLRRSVEWSEAAIVVPWLWVIHLTFGFLGGVQQTPLGLVAWLGLAAYAVGSFLNSASETLRKRWKNKPENKGRLYTEGLFRYSMHINYFGDSLLFTGFALLTGSWWALAIPAVMTLAFRFQHIPQLDAYLREHYGLQFEEYAARTSRFVPFLA